MYGKPLSFYRIRLNWSTFLPGTTIYILSRVPHTVVIFPRFLFPNIWRNTTFYLRAFNKSGNLES